MARPSDNLDKLRNHSHSNYIYQEYPKWITRSSGKKMIVQDAYEEEQIQEEDQNLPQSQVESDKIDPLALSSVDENPLAIPALKSVGPGLGAKPQTATVQKLTPKPAKNLLAAKTNPPDEVA